MIIVTWNCEAALRRCLTALEASQDRAQFEILTVDAGSSDGSPRIDLDFPRVTVLRLPRNFGKARARNIGMRTALSDLVCFLDPNIEVQPAAISQLAALLESRDDAAAAAPSLSDPAGKALVTSFRLPDAAQLADASLNGTPLPRVAATDETLEAADEFALIVRKNFIAGMNYLDEKRFSEHWSLLEVCWQIRNAGKKVLFAPSVGATLYPAAAIRIDETLYTSDRVAGAAAYIGKHNGMWAGISFRIKCLFRALGSFRLSLALSILTGSRLDPTQ